MTFWNDLSARERMIVGYSIPPCLLIIFYLYAWQPMSENLKRLRVDVPQKTAELAWVKHELEISKKWLAGNTSTGAQKPILTVIESHAIQSKIKQAIQRAQPDKNQVKLWFQEVVADHWFDFVNRLAYDGISVNSATLTRSKDGNINVRVTFSR